MRPTPISARRPAQFRRYDPGSCPLNEAGDTAGIGDYAAQAATFMQNMNSALKAAGPSPTDVVSTRVLVASTEQKDLDGHHCARVRPPARGARGGRRRAGLSQAQNTKAGFSSRSPMGTTTKIRPNARRCLDGEGFGTYDVFRVPRADLLAGRHRLAVTELACVGKVADLVDTQRVGRTCLAWR